MKKLLFYASSIFCSTASAESVKTFMPDAGDKSIEFLDAVFGGFVRSIADGGNGSDVAAGSLGKMFATFNAACLLVSIFFVVIIVVRSFVTAAATAKMLEGEQKIWLPLRILVGSGMLLPMPSGYTAMQAILMWIILNGVGLADRVWTAALEEVEQKGWISPPILPETRKAAAVTLRSLVCKHALNKMYADRGDNYRVEEYAKTAITNGEKYSIETVEWRVEGGPYRDANVCGGFNLIKNQNDTGDAADIENQLRNAHIAALRTMIDRLEPVAAQIVDQGGGVSAAVIDEAANDYKNQLATAVNSILMSNGVGGTREFIETAKASGWIYAGTWFPHLSKLNDSLQSSLNAIPTAQTITALSKEVDDDLVSYKDAFAVANSIIESDEDSLANHNRQAEAGATASDDAYDIVIAKISAPFLKMLDWMTTEISGSNLNHLGQVKAFGDGLLWVASSVFIAIFGLAGAGGSLGAHLTVGAVFDLSSALSAVAPTLSVMTCALFGFGMMLAVYLPLIPWITWMTSVVNWLVLVLEAMIVTPIFTVAHVTPEGHDVLGSAAKGWGLVLNLFFRPVLMIFGFWCGFLLMEPVSGLVNSSFMTIVTGTQAGSLSGLMIIIGYVFVYVSVSITVCHLCFGLIHWIPDNCMRWVSAGVSALHNAQGVEEKAQSMVHGGTHVTKDVGMRSLETRVKDSAGSSAPPAGAGGGSGITNEDL